MNATVNATEVSTHVWFLELQSPDAATTLQTVQQACVHCPSCVDTQLLKAHQQSELWLLVTHWTGTICPIDQHLNNADITTEHIQWPANLRMWCFLSC